MKFFWLNRIKDVNGTSGTGIVAEGVVFTDGTAVLTWFSKYKTVCFFQSIQELEDIHGHCGSTVVVWTKP